MTNVLTPFRDHPDYQAAYIRLVEKVYRTGLYYRLCSSNYRTRANNGGKGSETAAAVSDSLARAADDMDFIFRKAVSILPDDEVERIVADNPTAFPKLNRERRSA